MEDRQSEWATNYGFVDILKERRYTSDFIWVTRKGKPKRAWIQIKNISPSELKSQVYNNQSITRLVKVLSETFFIPQQTFFDIITKILKETGFSSNFLVIRIFAILLSNVFKKLLYGIFVNEAKLLKIKSLIGKNPVVFVPSHKSYCDFITMAYICFHYEIEIPKIAAGSDFQKMNLLGNLLRETGAFYIRRSFKEDKIYSKVFSTFVETLIEKGNSPVEFFIEGTRSRTSESLVPKLGFLTMVLKPFFFGKVPNITLIPVNLSYDKILEEQLFAIELIGVPKPKESTMGLIKALSWLKENKYGNIYVNFGNPISVKQYFKSKLDRSIHGVGPIHSQELSSFEKKQINQLAHTIIIQQRELTIFNLFNLIALILNDNLMTSQEPLCVNDLLNKVLWIFSVLKILVPESVIFAMKDISKEDILYHLKLHEPLIHLTMHEKVQIGKVYTHSQKIDLTKSEGHILSPDIIEVAIPLIMLQNYLNPCSFFLISVCFISLIIQSSLTKIYVSKADLFDQFKFLCTIFYYKFVFYEDSVEQYFENSLLQSQKLNIINVNNNDIKKGSNDKLHDFFYRFCLSYIPGYIMVIEILFNLSEEEFSEKQVLECYQKKVESEFKNKCVIHPANLCFNIVKNALQALTSMKALQIQNKSSQIIYNVNKEKMKIIQAQLRSLYFFEKKNFNFNFLQHISSFMTSTL